jgi:hypothetical protein
MAPARWGAWEAGVANMQRSRQDHPELEQLWTLYDETMSFVPNSLFTMARRPEILGAFSDLSRRSGGPGRCRSG